MLDAIGIMDSLSKRLRNVEEVNQVDTRSEDVLLDEMFKTRERLVRENKELRCHIIEINFKAEK